MVFQRSATPAGSDEVPLGFLAPRNCVPVRVRGSVHGDINVFEEFAGGDVPGAIVALNQIVSFLAVMFPPLGVKKREAAS